MNRNPAVLVSNFYLLVSFILILSFEIISYISIAILVNL